jgi:hypothetical protein
MVGADLAQSRTGNVDPGAPRCRASPRFAPREIAASYPCPVQNVRFVRLRHPGAASRVGVGVRLAVALVLSGALLGAPSPTAATTTESPTPLPSDAPAVLIIGDSTTVHMRDAFEAALRARGLDATVDAKSGRTVLEGRRVLASYDVSDYDYVVVLLGANGKRSSSLRNMRALKAAGVDTVATVQAPEQATVNGAVRSVFGTDRIPWAGHAKRLGIRTTDGKHYTRAAYAERARYLARKIAERSR